MSPEQEKHLQELKDEFCSRLDAKYRKGQAEHGGDLWRKVGLIEMLLEEVLDFWAYSFSALQQIKASGVQLGEIKDKDQT